MIHTDILAINSESRRERMLSLLDELRVLKAELRNKYGELNIEEELDAMRNERLAEMCGNV